jgi:hypothetical protein
MFIFFIVFAPLKQVLAQTLSESEFSRWQLLVEKNTSQTLKSIKNTSQVKKYAADTTLLRTILLNSVKKTPQQPIIITLPLPDGSYADFSLTAYAVMATALAEKYSEIKTFRGYQIDNPENNGRFDITEHGFHGMFLFKGKMAFIEPAHNESYYLSYFQHDKTRSNSNAFHKQEPKRVNNEFLITGSRLDKKAKAVQITSATSSIKTYQLAISASGEYSTFHGGTKTKVLGELVTLVNRLNDVYGRDLAIQFQLVANNDQLIHLDAATDPFNNDDQDGGINTAIIDGIIGSANYDIGHVVNTNGGGLAVLGGGCNQTYKGDGITGSGNPINDAFYIDYVAHEVGHQLGAEHTFNGTEGACDGNRSSIAAYEPGSASTIMGYAGICGSQNLQNNSMAYFHAISIDQINEYSRFGTGSTCGIDSTTTNNIPTVDAGLDYTIPANTPFTLTGTATDEDQNTLTYDWQQFDLGTASSSAAEQIDDGSRPLFRVWEPVAIPTRTFPRMADILTGMLTIGEVYPATDRALNFRLLVRDDQGGVGGDNTTITVVDTGEAFAVFTPTSPWLSNDEVVTWKTSATELAPISCNAVDINLSIDGGNTFSINLATGVANTGSANVKVQNLSSTQGRIKVSCANNIFFAINGSQFVVDASLLAPIITGQNDLSVEEDASITLSAAMFSYRETQGESLVIATGDNYTVSVNTITPNTGFVGTLSVGITAVTQGVESEQYLATITVTAKPVFLPVPDPTPSKSSSGGSIYWLLLLMLYKSAYARKNFLKRSL